jgi:3-deoxy-manno-octulosonate cytidylyltransferase (CMP-KDO synthetase)
MAMDFADRCVIATDSDEVADVARSHGAEATLTRADHPSGTDRVAEVVGRPEFSDFDAIVNVQGDEPFVSADAVVGAANLVVNGAFPLGTAATRAPQAILEAPNIVKVVADDSGRAMYFSRAPIPFLRDARDAGVQARRVWQHLGVYAYSRSALDCWVRLPVHPLEQIERLEQLRPLAAGLRMGVAVIDRPAHPGIDTEEDLVRANHEWSHITTG